jgi:hypothetical protein
MYDHPDQLQVKPGDLLEIELEQPMNPNYRWRISEGGAVCEPEEGEYRSVEAGIGAGGMRTMRFRIRKPGLEKLRLKNLDEKSGDVYQEFEIQVSSVQD